MPDADAVRAEAVRLLPAALRDVLGARQRTVTDPRAGDPTVFAATDRDGQGLTVRVDAVALAGGRRARSLPNTISENHVIQLSDQLPVALVGRVLAYELGELSDARSRAAAGLGPSRSSLLRPGGLEAQPPALSARDAGRLGELNWLAARMTDAGLATEERAAARAEFSLILDDLGLRPREDQRSAVTPAEQDAVDWRSREALRRLSPAAAAGLRELGRPLGGLQPDDATQLLAARSASADRFASAGLNGGNGADRTTARLSTAELAERARRAADARDGRSRLTLGQLREEAARLPEGELPRRRLMIGGGASLAGRAPDMLVVDDRGRWHVDPIRAIVQSADQVREIYDSGLGDPYQVAAPRERVPLTAIQLWEDEAAASGPVLDGRARLFLDAEERLVAEVQPLDGSAPVRFEVEGTPLVATGVPPEVVPGASGLVPRIPEARTVLVQEFAGLGTAQGDAAASRLSTVADRPGAGQEAIDIIRASVPDWVPATGSRAAAAVQTLNAFACWDGARAAAPGRALHSGEVAAGLYDPMAADSWLLAGIGGAGSTTAEIVLEANPNATVVMVGLAVPWVQNNDAQYLAMRARYDASMGGDGRLVLVTGERLGAVELVDRPDGRTVFRAGGQEGEAYVGCLGRLARLPNSLDGVSTWAQEHGGHIKGELMFDADRQYLGYKLSIGGAGRTVDVEVVGAASRTLPQEVFGRDEAQLVARLGGLEAPVESGNFAGGFMATALQARRYAEHRGYPPVTAAAPPGDRMIPAPKDAEGSSALRLAGIGLERAAATRRPRSAPSSAPPRPAGPAGRRGMGGRGD